jgi:leader peptidase (prepilin peptidase)/N-methyltransferase
MAPLVELINGWILPVLAAPFIGSFLGVLVRRLPEGRRVAFARSACGACRHTLGPADMVPVLSFVASRGRCRHCGAPIPRFHLWIELAALAVPISAAVAESPLPGGPALWAGCALGWALLALAWIDAASWRLPDVLTLPLILAGLLQTMWLEPEALFDRALAAALGYTAFLVLNLTYRRLRGRDGLGLGDAKLLAAGGAWLGVAALPGVVLAAALAALAWAAAQRLRGVTLSGESRLAFGPFLAAGIWLMWLLAGAELLA